MKVLNGITTKLKYTTYVAIINKVVIIYLYWCFNNQYMYCMVLVNFSLVSEEIMDNGMMPNLKQ